MQTCNACHIHVESETPFCPLCGSSLNADSEAPKPVLHNPYPNLVKQTAQANFFARLFLFITLFGCLFSVVVNLLTHPGFLWCLIVVAAALYCWLTIPPLLRRGVNFAKQIVFAMLLTSALVVVLDLITGYRGWSVNYVVPALLAAGILSTTLMSIFNRTNWTQYVLYQFIIGIFGFVPLLLFLFNISQSIAMVLLTTGLALASLLFTFIFGDRSIKSEFRRRFHL